MTDVNSLPALLINALQDLHDGEAALVERLPSIADQITNDNLRALLDQDAINSAEQQRRIANLIVRRDGDIEGAPNIWLRAILDDADRDTDNIEKGQLLDIALIGAIRKAKQAERVSYETAIALAESLGDTDAATLEVIRDEEASTDAALAEFLAQLTAPIN